MCEWATISKVSLWQWICWTPSTLLPRDAMRSAHYTVSRCHSVRPSFWLRYCVTTAERRENSSPPRHVFLVFNWITSNGGDKYRWRIKILEFWTKSHSISETILMLQVKKTFFCFTFLDVFLNVFITKTLAKYLNRSQLLPRFFSRPH